MNNSVMKFFLKKFPPYKGYAETEDKKSGFIGDYKNPPPPPKRKQFKKRSK